MEERADDVVARAASILEEVTAEEHAAEPSTDDQAPADLAAPETVAAEDAAATAVPTDPLLEQFNTLWDQYSDVLTKKGFFADRPEYTVSNSKRSEIGAVKRASLQAARERIDILYSLPAEKVVALSKAELPYVDRKTENAKERLVATFVEQSDLGVGDGGKATTQDLIRMLLCARVACSLDSKRAQKLADGSNSAPLHPDFVVAVNDILPHVMAVLEAEPEEEALAKAKVAQEAREAELAAMPKADRRENRSSFFRERDTGGNFRPGDWLCPECNAQNFARRTECFRCDAQRPEGAGGPPPRAGGRFGGDRYGGDCAVRRDQQAFGERRGFESKPGDWACPACNANNFARRMECYQCSEPRPASAGPVPSREPRFGSRDNFRDGPRRDAPVMKQGDWMCPECNGHNFASRSDCFRCSFPRPASAGPPSGGRSSSSGWTERAPFKATDSIKPTAPADLDW
ncbi:probable zinc finger Ran-binding domain-containing protein 2 at C-terminar half [Coccomyxa sp. Obi]|nr:probable zinc finger Ran-binding domain-containing protein 2 at C-terminar half [Coccomyxa sp. Obi]